MRYDNIKSAVLAVVMLSARPWDSEEESYVYDERALVQVSTKDGTITRIGMPVLPDEEDSAASREGISICSSASTSDGLVDTDVAQVSTHFLVQRPSIGGVLCTQLKNWY